MKTWFLAVLLLTPAVGCLQFRGTGPIFGDGPTAKPSATNPAAMILPDGTAPVLPAAPPPPAPAHLISAADIDAANHADAVKKLVDEIEQDRRAADRFPNYSSVSRVERK